MQAFKIDPIQQSSFIAIADKTEDLSRISHEPLCFSPINFTLKEVSPEEIKESDKIVVIDGTSMAKQITRDHALNVLGGGSRSDSDNLKNCLIGLTEAMQKINMAKLKFIQLDNQLEAIRLLDSFSHTLKPEEYGNIRRSIQNGNRQNIEIGGVEFRWAPSRTRVTSGRIELRLVA